MVANIVAVFPLNLKTKTNFQTDNILFFSCFLPHRSDRRADENGPPRARRNPDRRMPSGQEKNTSVLPQSPQNLFKSLQIYENLRQSLNIFANL
jgi:hypothetical protein